MNEEKRMEDIIDRIKNRRNELMMSYQDLADKTGLSKSTLQRYETGSIKNMPIDKLGILAKALNANPVWLMGYDVPKEIPNYINSTSLSQEETTLLENYNKLNDLGKSEANKRVAELTEIKKYQKETDKKIVELPNKKKEIWEEPGKEHLMPIASHDRNGEFTEEEYDHDDDLMDNEDFWK